VTNRPLEVIETDIRVTRRACTTCRLVMTTLLDHRKTLLALGWPDSHALCEELDRDAARWSAHYEHQRRALDALYRERDREDPRPEITV
jgi:hypothetical protein